MLAQSHGQWEGLRPRGPGSQANAVFCRCGVFSKVLTIFFMIKSMKIKQSSAMNLTVEAMIRYGFHAALCSADPVKVLAWACH